MNEHQGCLIVYAVDGTGQLENTIGIFRSYNGEMLGDHGIYLKVLYFYEREVRVPLIVSWPGTIAGGRSVPEMVELVDLAPTLLDAAGLAPFAGMQGVSLWALLRDSTGTADRKSTRLNSSH